MPGVCLQFVIVVFPDHTHLLFTVVSSCASVQIMISCHVVMINELMYPTHIYEFTITY